MDTKNLKVFNQLKLIENYARENYIPVLLSDSAKFLINQVSKAKPLKILEIGTAIGYSGSLMLFSFDGARLTTLEKDENSFKIANKNFESLGLKDRVNSILIDAIDFFKNSSEKYNFIFLDGPKGQYIKYLPYIIDALDINGILVADNVLFKGMVLSTEEPPAKHRTIVRNLRAFNDTIKNDDRFETELLKIGDGIIYAKRKR